MSSTFSPAATRRSVRQARGTSDVRTIVTPEGVPLNWELGGRGDRLGAFAIDLIVIVLGCTALWFLIGFIVFGSTGGWPRTSWAYLVGKVGVFLLYNFYFTIAELAWRGRTPGKYFLGLRVVDANGGPLLPGAVVARNLMRELEIFLPFWVMLAGAASGIPGWSGPLAALWLLFVGGRPLFSRDRQRVGDLLGGTWVIRQPRLELLPDLSAASPGTMPAGSGPSFERAQVEVYGIKELQTLETVLRNRGRDADAARTSVARTIQNKIGWTGGAIDPTTFLAAYYAALREHLENRLTLGERLEDKTEAAARRGRNGRNGERV